MSGTPVAREPGPVPAWRVREEELRGWLRALAAGEARFVAPVEADGLVLYRIVERTEELPLSPGRAKWSPKEFLFPQTEPLYSYAVRAGEVELADPAGPRGEVILWGVPPCDAAGLARLDRVFLGDVRDPFYERRRRQLSVVSLACSQAQPECFCTAVGGSPHGTEGADVRVVELADGFLVSACTPKGEALVAAGDQGWARATERDRAEAEEAARRAASTMTRRALDGACAAELASSFGARAWETLARRCLGCGICAFVCPTCSCFDMHAETRGWQGTQCRTWDSCAFALFTRHASGHNPRPNQASRYRQRVLHKFAYYPGEREGKWMCVGCGRCTRLCPAGMDIHQSVMEVLEEAGRRHGVSD